MADRSVTAALVYAVIAEEQDRSVSSAFALHIRQVDPPAAPTDLALDLDEATKDVNLTWTDNATNETYYEVERSVDGGTSYSSLSVLDPDTTSDTDTTATQGFDYCYRVRAVANDISSAYSNVVCVPDPSPEASASVGVGVGASVGGPGSFTDIEFGENFDAFFLFHGVGVPQGATINTATIDMVASQTESASVSYTIEGGDLDSAYYPATEEISDAIPRTTANVSWSPGAWNAGTEYSTSDLASIIQEIVDRSGWQLFNNIIIYANNNGSSGSRHAEADPVTLTITFSYPTAPYNLVATALVNGNIRLDWEENISNEQWFEVERSTDGMAWSVISDTVEKNATTYTDTSTSNDTLYYYRVRGANLAAYTAYSNEATATSSYAGRHGAQWRAYVGPRITRDDDAAFWDWSALNYENAYTPIADTTLNGDFDAGDTTATLTDATNFPSAGGFWVYNNDTGESIEYVEYTGKSSNGPTGCRRETTDEEQTGNHADGATVQFWYPLTMAEHNISFDEDTDENKATSVWSGRLSGVNAPVAALRNGHLVLVQTRNVTSDDATWSSWTNLLVGWLYDVRIRDDADKRREWSATVKCSALGMASELPVRGLTVGEENAALRGNATASSTLNAAYKAVSGEFVAADPDLGPNSAIDADIDTLWISERYIGENNPVPLQSTGYSPGGKPSGIREKRGVTQFHVSTYTGQGEGYRWIEVTAFADTSLTGDWIIAGYHKAVNLEGSGITISAGAHAIFAENAELYAEENGSPENGTVYDLSDYGITDLNNSIVDVDNGGATGGTFTLEVDVTSPDTTAAIAYDATAADVQTALEGTSEISTDEVRVSGDAASGWTVNFVNGAGSQSVGLNVDTDSTTGGGGVSTNQTQVGGFPYSAGLSGNRIFDYLPATGGLIRLYWAPTGQGQSQVAYGSGEAGFSTWNPVWNGSSIAAQDTGETARMIFDQSGSTTGADYWEVGAVHTPGYVMETGDIEWWMIELPEMGLQLYEDITATTPGNGSILRLQNEAGTLTTEYLPDSGDIQIGSEQISYASNDRENGELTLAGSGARGANSTTPAAHSEGDKIYYVDSSVATTAVPIDTIEFIRKSGVATLEDFTIRRSRLSTARTPDQNNYTTDYHSSTAVTGHASATYSMDLSSSPERIKYVLIEISKMSTQPDRARINTMKAIVDPDVLGSSYRMASATSGEAIERLLQNAGIPDGAIVDNGDTNTVVDYVTESGTLWSVIQDMADMHAVRVRCERDSKFDIRLDPYWTNSSFVPTVDDDIDRAVVSDVDYVKKSGRTVGQVKLYWRSPDNSSGGSVTFPTSADDFGDLLEIGSEERPEVYADSTAAQAAARKAYWLERRPYETNVQIAGIGLSYETYDILQLEWDLDSNMANHDRTYMVLGTSHAIDDYGWSTALNVVQVSKEDER